MQNIFITGSHGYAKNYGGWETFVKNFCDYYDKTKANIYVTAEIKNKKAQIEKIDGIYSLPIYTSLNGSVRMMVYSIKSLFYLKKYIKKNRIDNAIIYILGLRVGPFLKLLRPSFRKYHIKVYVNPDGLEWKRSKWNKLIKKYFLYCERTMLKNCDGIICDSLGIKKYLEERYPNNHVPKHFIAYGTKEVDLSDVNEKDILKEYNLKKNAYCLVVGRCVPENNFEFIIKEFMASKTNKKLVIISNIAGSKYFEKLKEITGCECDKRITILNGIYDEKKLSVIRKNAYLYIHGHSVGGTNPSLLEALRFTSLNLLYDVTFNREVGKSACLYFTLKEGSLTKLLDNEAKLKEFKKTSIIKAQKRINDEYTWPHIIEKYTKVFGVN